MRRLAILAVLLVGCRGASKSNADARSIVRAYEAFQNANAADRPAALESLSSVPCAEPKLCADRDTCVTYAKHLFRAQDLARRARELGPEDAGGSGAATPAELAVIVSAADDEAKAASTNEPLCRASLERLYTLSRD